MVNNNKRVVEAIIAQFFNNRYSKDTENRVLNWLTSEVDEELKDRAMLDVWNSVDLKNSKEEHKKQFSIFKRKAGIEDVNSYSLKRLSLQIAAVLMPLFLVSGWFYLDSIKDFFAYYSNPEMVELSVPNAESKLINLEDGTQIRVNSGCQLPFFRTILKEVKETPKKPVVTAAKVAPVSKNTVVVSEPKEVVVTQVVSVEEVVEDKVAEIVSIPEPVVEEEPVRVYEPKPTWVGALNPDVLEYSLTQKQRLPGFAIKTNLKEVELKQQDNLRMERYNKR